MDCMNMRRLGTSSVASAQGSLDKKCSVFTPSHVVSCFLETLKSTFQLEVMPFLSGWNGLRTRRVKTSSTAKKMHEGFESCCLIRNWQKATELARSYQLRPCCVAVKSNLIRVSTCTKDATISRTLLAKRIRLETGTDGEDKYLHLRHV